MGKQTLQGDRNKNLGKIVNLDEALGSLMPGGSLSAYVKYSIIQEKVPCNDLSNQCNSRYTIKLTV